MNNKVYCRDCKFILEVVHHRWGSSEIWCGKTTMKTTHVKETWYAPAYERTDKVYEKCCEKNKNNDCRDFIQRGRGFS